MTSIYEKAFSETVAIPPVESPSNSTSPEETMQTEVSENNQHEHLQLDTTDDVIVVSPGSDIGKYQKVEEPMSRLKMQRLKEKERKEQRKKQQRIDRVRQRQSTLKMNEHNQTQRKASAEAHKPKHAKWQEGQKQALSVYNQIKNFEEVASQAILLINRQDFTIDDKSKAEVTQRVNAFMRDIEDLKDRWGKVCEPMEGKTGNVDLEEYPLFYVVYEDLLQLGIDIINVLSEPANVITNMMGAIIEAVNTEIDKMEMKGPE
jgi:hypothetical protein